MTWEHTEDREFVENATILHRFESFQHLSYMNYFINGSIPTEVNDQAHMYKMWLHN